MTSAIETVRAFYPALGRGDAPVALGLMAEEATVVGDSDLAKV
jgi:ketosteroid isomerase-like protein